MTIVNSADVFSLTGNEREQVYNAMDCAVPHGILATLLEMLDEDAARVYQFERGMQGVALMMATRGMCVDEVACAEVVEDLRAREARCEKILAELAWAWGEPNVNPRSPQQVKHLLYDVCGEAPYHERKGRAGTITVNEDALRDLSIRSPLIGTIATTVLRARELRKATSFLTAKRGPDGRIHSTFNVGSTKFGRWSSSQDIYKEGLNFFNLPKDARRVIVPSRPSRALVNIDLKQAESRIVAYIAEDEGYIAAHKSGNVHVDVACSVFGLTKEQVLAKGKGPGSPYDTAKHIQHGTNYGLGERHAARMTNMRVGKTRENRERFFTSYPGNHARITGMSYRLRYDPYFLYASGRGHLHLGHWKDHETIKEALAGEPQGTVADVLNVCVYRLWEKYDDSLIWLLNTNYDSVLFEAERDGLDDTLELVKKEMVVELAINGRTTVIPCDIGVGQNWKEAS